MSSTVTRDRVVAGLDEHRDRAVRRRVPQRVRQQVVQDALDLVRRAAARVDGRVDLRLERHVRARASASTPRRQDGRAPASSRLAQLERERAAVDPGELEEVVDERRERANLVAQRGQVVVGIGEPVLDRLEHRLHVRERGAQVVARPRDQLAARVEEALEARGHLVERARERAQLGGSLLAGPCREVPARERGRDPRETRQA